MIKFTDKLKTIKSECESRLKEKGSTFISISKPIKNEEEAHQFLDSVRKKFYDATHHCYSYQFADGNFKYSDDGEPGGTAGKRIYNAQNHFELTNLITIVIRYYGGVKLGVGPLGKAYYESALECLKSAEMEEQFLHEKIEIRYNFENSSLIHHLISKYSVIIKGTNFVPEPVILGLIMASAISDFQSELTAASNNQIVLKMSGESTYLKK